MMVDKEKPRGWMKRFLPWGVSVGLHLVLALVLALLLFQPVRHGAEKGSQAAYSPDSLPRRVEPQPMKTKIVRKSSSGESGSMHDVTGIKPQWSSGAGEEGGEASGDEHDVQDDMDEGSGPPATPPSGDAASGSPQSASFFGAESTAKDVVYLIDFSASVKGAFGKIQREMLRSISQLNDEQRFQIILFAEGRPLITPAGRLVPASRKARRSAAQFLHRVEPSGRTDPIAALQRAFSVLNRSRKKTKLICLLTDGAFPDDTRVMRIIKKMNAHGNVRINTFLYGGRKGSGGILRRIARENGGAFVRVER